MIDVQGWVTLTNTTGTTFANARTLLVAGEVASSDDGNRVYRPARPRRQPPMQAGTETANREQLGDFYLYPLPERTTIADRQTKQVSFLDVKGAPATTGYRFVNNWLGTTEQPVSAQSIVRFSNAAKGGLGDALPAGTIRVYMRDARGQPQFTGEAAIDHTPQGSKIALATGDAFDVKVRAVVESRTRITDRRWQTKMRYTVTNATPAAVTVDVVQGGLDWSDTRITDQSRTSERVDAGQAVWQVPVPANGSTTVTATFDTRY